MQAELVSLNTRMTVLELWASWLHQSVILLAIRVWHTQYALVAKYSLIPSVSRSQSGGHWRHGCYAVLQCTPCSTCSQMPQPSPFHQLQDCHSIKSAQAGIIVRRGFIKLRWKPAHDIPIFFFKTSLWIFKDISKRTVRISTVIINYIYCSKLQISAATTGVSDCQKISEIIGFHRKSQGLVWKWFVTITPLYLPLKLQFHPFHHQDPISKKPSDNKWPGHCCDLILMP